MTQSGDLWTGDGCRLAWRSDGPVGAPAVLLGNSLGTTMAMWDDQVAVWAGRRRIIRFDNRGHGKSGASPAGYAIERLGHDALAVLDGLGIARADFVGLSLGGMVGQWLGFSAPDRIGRLVIANSSARMGPPDSWDARIAAVEAGGTAAIVPAVIARWFTPEFIASDPAAVTRIERMLRETSPAGYGAACAAIRDMDFRSALPAITASTLIIAGERDPATPLEHSRELAEAIPGARLMILPGAHLGNVECTAAFTRDVGAFLAI
ncbi:MAG: 3-oxoadipate enol-lactonase [Novosphingobium sp.]